MTKPRLFIGSSSEAKYLAKAVQQELEEVAECVRWDQNVFRLNRSNLESLLAALEEFHYAVFIFAPDDELTIRDNAFKAVRDNVIFEFGLFLGKKNRDQVFALAPKNTPRVRELSDLYGITLGQYEPDADNPRGAVGPPCTQIAEIIKRTPVELKRPPLLEQIATGIGSLGVDLKTLRDAMIEGISTRYLGKFPDFFQTHIIPCLQGSTREFHIACDFPTYGFFSALQVHLTYMNLLQTKKQDGVAIHVLFLERERRRIVSLQQMPNTQKAWDLLMKNVEFEKRVRDLSRKIGQPINGPKHLEDALMNSHDFGANDFKDNIASSYDEMDSKMPVYLWIADGRRAIFSIPHFGVVPTEHGFETTNRDLVESLQLLWQRYKDKDIPPVNKKT